MTLLLSFQGLGAIYDDIGTSLLYVYTSILPTTSPTEKQTLGAMSCIFWGFTLVVMVKYCFIVLLLGPNNGEAGQIVIYSKLARTLHVGPREPCDQLLLFKTATRVSFVNDVRSQLNGLFGQKVLPGLLMFMCFFGCSLVISDGILTPTTSATPRLNNAVLPVSRVILIVLFVAQRTGSGRLSYVFAPVVFVWFLAISVIGIINISRHPAIFKALSPKFAIVFLRKEGGVDALDVMLAMTGVEAMFAVTGHFGALPVQLELSCVVYPALMLAYLGQGAYLIRYPDSITNVFYLSLPGGVGGRLYWFMLALATLATITASQALIIGVFGIFRQLIHIDCFPSFRVIHVSNMTFMNYIFMAGVVLTTVGFQNGNAVTAAYGLGVSMDFLVTSLFIMFCMIYVFQLSFYVYVTFVLGFGVLDMCFVVDHEYDSRVRPGSIFFNVDRKVELTVHMLVLGESSKGMYAPIRAIDDNDEDNAKPLRLLSLPDSDMPRVPNTVVFVHTGALHMLHSPNTVLFVVSRLLAAFPGFPEHVVFLGVSVTDAPYVSGLQRVTLAPMRRAPGFYRANVRLGFMETTQIPVPEMLETIGAHDTTQACKRKNSLITFVCTFAIEQLFTPLDRLFAHRQYLDNLYSEDGRYREDVLFVGSAVRL
ncbi:potassium transporter [Lipomyces arxii]|uniref:potassium transporter n=1 Tax=Lipomyces arxii TaxID=56418 RepID=UPI0034CD87E5